MKLQLSRSFVTVILFLACVALVLLTQETKASDPNKCNTDWDFCNSGTEAENAYYWRLGWCAAAIERGAVSTSPSACMGQEEGTVTFPPSSPAKVQRLSPASAQLEGTPEPSPPQPPPSPPDDNACHDWGDLCDSGTEAENEYHWRLGWCVWAVKTGAVSVSVSACMGEPEGTVSHPPWSPHPEGTPEPSPPNPGGGPPWSSNPDGGPPSSSNPSPRPHENLLPPPPGFSPTSSEGSSTTFYKQDIPPGHVCDHWEWDIWVPNTNPPILRERRIAYCTHLRPIYPEPEDTPEPDEPA